MGRVSLALVIGIAVGMIGTQLWGAQHERVKRTVLMTRDLDGLEGHEGRMYITEIAPESATGKHHHSAHEFGYILAGFGIFTVEGHQPITLQPGGILHIGLRQPHNIENISKTVPLRMLVVAFAEKGQPLVEPVK